MSSVLEKISILYGSETGNCQDLSKMVAWSISRLDPSISIEFMACDEYPIDRLIEERFILFICSTSGLGDVPLNMKSFWKFLLRKDLPRGVLYDLSFAIIGLGDSSYKHYNFVAKKLLKRLLYLGAENVLEFCLGDDQHEHGPFYTIDPWLEKFYQMLSPSNKFDPSESFTRLINSSFVVKSLRSESKNELDEEIENINGFVDDSIKTGYHPLKPYEAVVVENKRMSTEDHFQDIRLISLELEVDMHYDVTDICVVYPENSAEDVDRFLDLFNKSDKEDAFRIDPNEIVRITLDTNRHNWIPKSSYYWRIVNKPIMIQEIITKYFDINAIPKRSFFDLFYRFSRNDLEREKLKSFATGFDLEDLNEYVNRPKRTILEVMSDFPFTTPYVPIDYLFDLIPSISPRSYSIASSPSHSTSLQILYGVVIYKTRLKKPRLGQCTNWMVRQKPNHSKLSIYFRPGSFVLPSPTTPIIMIAAGLGLAPFRAFILERTHNEESVDCNYLFFGCRNKDKDYFIEKEFEKLIAANLLRIYPAFSRQDPQQKIYVQDVVWIHRDLIFDLLFERKANIYVAGKSQQYPDLVREILARIFKDKFDTDNTNLSHYDDIVDKFVREKRIQFECW